ncbi:MAG: hypothetical protein Q8P41_01675 [Pseudomonadota bacterium]|nr:hypothetical protein [Pseudomonadota bacterium]
MSPDARTTPPALRIPILACLLALGAYNVWCWQNALGSGEPSLPRWFATWQMFTLRDPGHAELFGDVLVAGEWKPVELESLFPTRWESGPRYARSSFWKSIPRMRVLAASTCTRHPEHPTRVRFRVDRWDKTLGSLKQPKRKLRTEDLLEWDCTRPAPLPAGKPL